MEVNKFFSIFCISILLLMLKSLNAWFLWNVDGFILDLLALISGLTFIHKMSDSFRVSSSFWLVALFLFLSILWNTKIGIGSMALLHLPFLLVFGLSESYKVKMLEWWTKIYAIILSVSLVAWLFSWTGLLPSFGDIQYLGNLNYTYTNYILCIRGLFYDIRFNSIFLEPGHTAMIAAFTLFANRFDLKNKWVLSIFVCTLFTFSLAGYVLMVIGYFLLEISKHHWKVFVRKLFPYVAVAFVIYYAGTSYNGGNNLLNELIIERLMLDDEKGFAGNNRTSELTDDNFYRFVKSSDFLSGLSPQKYNDYLEEGEIYGAGYKLYMMKKGLVGTILIFLFYLLLFRVSLDKRFVFCMLLLYIVAFWQRAYPLWYAWMFLFLFTTSKEYELEGETLD